MLNKRCCHDATFAKSHTMWFLCVKKNQNKSCFIHKVVITYYFPWYTQCCGHVLLATSQLTHKHTHGHTHTHTHTVLLTTACHVAHKAVVVNCLLHFQAPEAPQNRTGVQQLLVNDFEHICSYLPVTIAA